MLPQGSLHSPTMWPGVVAPGLSRSCPGQYNGPITLKISCEHAKIGLCCKALQALLEHLGGRRRAMNPQKIQGAGTDRPEVWVSLARWDACCPEAIFDKVQVYPAQECERGANLQRLGVWVYFYSPPGTVPLSLMPSGKERAHMGQGIRVASHL